MGRVIIELKNGQSLSFKCKSKIRAEEIFNRRPNSISFNYYERNDRIPKPKKKIKKQNNFPESFEELDILIRSNNKLLSLI